MLSRCIYPLAALSLICFSVHAEDIAYDEQGLVEDFEEDVIETPAPKKLKPQYAGARRAPPKATTAEKKTTRPPKNKWFSSKTHPKLEKKKIAHVEEETLLAEEPPYYSRSGRRVEEIAAAEAPTLTEGERYPQAGFQAPHGHVFLTGEWLFWTTRQGGMEYATARASTSPGVFTHAVSRKVNFDYQSGFRVGLGVHLPQDRWDIYANYTDFRPDHSSNTEGSVFPLLLYQGQFSTSNVTDASAEWHIAFQNLEVEIGRAYYIGKSLSFRPHIGFKGAWIDQRAHFEYQGGDVPAGGKYHVKTKNDFKGAGPRIGLESEWHLGCGFSLFGNMAAALILGQFNLKQDQKQQGIDVIEMHTVLNLAAPTVQLVAGLEWDRNFYHDRCHFGIGAGFEAQYWWRQNQMERFTDSTQPIYVRTSEDLSLYGLTLRARVDF
ncbi:MAG: hypothetical protein JSS61_00910 [Verrucomicrobia bacterium]|nr:hypothetical protein [Verrucomicrobiota bacterium]